MSRADRIALLISFLAILLAYLVTVRIFESMPHIEDEIAYVWQAEAIAGGRLTLPSPDHPKSFLVPFVVDFNGQRFGKYPLGWPALLGIGVFFNARSLVNPLLAGLGVWLTYRLGKRLFGEPVGLLAAALTVTSPFFLMNSGSLLSHPFGLVLSIAFALTWLDAWESPAPPKIPARRRPTGRRWVPLMVSALALGTLILTRPFTAMGIAIPFGLHALYLLLRSDWDARRRLLLFGMVVLALASLHFMWQYAVTGDPTLNPYTLWWEYDKVGFGPGMGRTESGHTLQQARINTNFSLWVGAHDLFGWGEYSWIFLPFGLWAALRNRLSRTLLVAGVYPTLVIIYLAYWIGSSLFGPRYFYEGLHSLTLFSAAGIAFLAGWPVRPDQPWVVNRGWRAARPLLVTAGLALLISTNLLFYTPMRVGGMYGLYDMSRSRMAPFLTPQAQALAPALVIVHPGRWMDYGTLLDMQDPFLNTPFIFVYSRGPSSDAAVAADFPQRTLIHYYTDQPNLLYKNHERTP